MQEIDVTAEIGHFLRETVVDGGAAPSAAAGVAEYREGQWRLSAGATADGIIEQPFDLASLSKPFFVVLVSELVRKGWLSWQTPLQEVLPKTKDCYAGPSSIESLLSHRAGLLPHIEFFRRSWGGYPIEIDRILSEAANAARTPVSRAPLYSDLGYILAGFAVQKLGKQPLDCLFHEHLFHPWSLRVGSSRSWNYALSDFTKQVAPTELQVPRGGVLRGVVHDDNAWALAGAGTCAHAGLFAPLSAVLHFGCHLIDAVNGRAGAQKAGQIANLVRSRPGGTLRMGFDGLSGEESLAGRLPGPNTFGHLGFTGTSFWCDPDSDKVTVLLTNRVYPNRSNRALTPLRPKIHDFLWSS